MERENPFFGGKYNDNLWIVQEREVVFSIFYAQ